MRPVRTSNGATNRPTLSSVSFPGRAIPSNDLRTAGKARIRTLMSRRSERTAATLTDQIWAALRSQTVTVVAEAT